MKIIVENFRNFLTEAEMGQYVEGGMVTLYHYTRNPGPTLLLDPEYKKSYHSSKEFQTAQTPRVFFYVDPKQRENFFRRGIPLFTTEVPANRIYNFRNDPDGYREKHKHPTYGLRKGEEWNTMLEDIRDSYDGIFYSLSNFDVVAWFQPIEVTRVSTEQQADLES